MSRKCGAFLVVIYLHSVRLVFSTKKAISNIPTYSLIVSFRLHKNSIRTNNSMDYEQCIGMCMAFKTVSLLF